MGTQFEDEADEMPDWAQSPPDGQAPGGAQTLEVSELRRIAQSREPRPQLTANAGGARGRSGGGGGGSVRGADGAGGAGGAGGSSHMMWVSLVAAVVASCALLVCVCVRFGCRQKAKRWPRVQLVRASKPRQTRLFKQTHLFQCPSLSTSSETRTDLSS